MITILLQKILEQVKALKTNIENLPTGGSDEYSTTEHEVGKWIDGRTVYEKTINIPYINKTDNVQYFNHGISDLDSIISYFGYAESNKWPIPYVKSTSSLMISLWTATQIVFATRNMEDGSTNVYITLRYIKVTTP